MFDKYYDELLAPYAFANGYFQLSYDNIKDLRAKLINIIFTNIGNLFLDELTRVFKDTLSTFELFAEFREVFYLTIPSLAVWKKCYPKKENLYEFSFLNLFDIWDIIHLNIIEPTYHGHRLFVYLIKVLTNHMLLYVNDHYCGICHINITECDDQICFSLEWLNNIFNESGSCNLIDYDQIRTILAYYDVKFYEAPLASYRYDEGKLHILELENLTQTEQMLISKI